MADMKKQLKGEVAVYRFYKIEGNAVTRNKRDCPRCGKGVFMAEHREGTAVENVERPLCE